MVGAVCLLSMLIICTGMVGCQRRNVLQEAMKRVKSYPSHRSSSPSWGGERQFEIIGTGRLPIQDQRYSAQGGRLTSRPGAVRRNKDVYTRPVLEKIDRYNPILIDSEQTISQTKRNEYQHFPSFDGFTIGFDSRGRKKRSADHDTFYHSSRARRRPRQQQSTLRYQPQSIDRFDDGGFWDDNDFRGEISGVTDTDEAQQERSTYNTHKSVETGSRWQHKELAKVGMTRFLTFYTFPNISVQTTRV